MLHYSPSAIWRRLYEEESEQWMINKSEKKIQVEIKTKRIKFEMRGCHKKKRRKRRKLKYYAPVWKLKNFEI